MAQLGHPQRVHVPLFAEGGPPAPTIEVMPSGDDPLSSEASWNRVRGTLERAFEVQAAERPALLEAALGDAPELLALAREMLLDDARTDDYMQPPVGAVLAAPRAREPHPAERIGPYELRRRLGAGGMGAVYLAVRADGAFQRQVALKLVHAGMDSGEVLARFHRERQVQANLSHPCIAALLDGGTTDADLSYLVMEYVDGTRIDEYCDEHRLSVVERLALVLKVCSAVQHAHERLVVHRDIKPSNILVTSAGEPKLLDFGIAKVLDPEKLSGGVEVTREVMQLMTPAYASPEQLRSRPITQASDLYSLGVLMYELLSGHVPYRLEGCSPTEVERLVCEERPGRPSAAVMQTRDTPAQRRRGATTHVTPELVSERRATRPKVLRQALSGDLDRIVLMCLRKEPRRRYASVAALAEDIGRFLAGKPIFARPDSLLYRADRFVRRHRWPVAAATIVIVALATSLGFALDQYATSRKAHALAAQRLVHLRSFRSDLLDELRRAFATLPGATSEASGLIRVALTHLDRELATAGSDPLLLTELTEAYTALASVRSNDALTGGLTEAIECYRKATDAAAAAYALAPDNARIARAYWQALATLGFQVGTQDVEHAYALLQRALDVLATRDASGAWPDGPNLAIERSTVYSKMCSLALVHGRADRAREFGDLALSNLDEHMASVPTAALFLRGERAHAQASLSAAELQLGNARRSLELLDEARSAFEASTGAHVPSNNVLRILPGVDMRRGRALAALDRADEAETALRASLAALRAIESRNSGNVLALLDVAGATRVLAHFLLERDRGADAAPLLEGVLAPLRELCARQPGHALLDTPLDHIELLLGRAHMQSGDRLAASQLIGNAQRRLAERASRSTADYATMKYLAEAHRSLALLRLAEASDGARATRDVQTARESLEAARTIITALEAETRGGTGLRELAHEVAELLERCERAEAEAR